MAAVLARLHLSTIFGKRQLLHALRRSSPAHQPAVLGSNAITLLCSAPLLVGDGRRLKYNAAAGVSLDDNIAAKHQVIGALDDELGTEEHHSSGGGSSPPLSSSREYHSVSQTEAPADGDGEKMATRAARGGSKAAVLLAWGEPLPGGGPHYN